MIRRGLLAYAPAAAFDKTIIHKNTTSIDNDKVRHRIGLLPVQYHGTTLHINVHNETDEAIIISTNTPLVKATGWIYPNIPLFKVLPGEEINLESTSIPGTGHMNAKWCIIENCHYSQEWEIHYKNEKLTSKSMDLEHIELLKTRLPTFFKNDELILEKVYIDTNVLENFNELLDFPFFTVKEYPNYTLSFDTINNVLGEQVYNETIDILMSQCNTKDYWNQAIANAVMHIVNQEEPSSFCTIHRPHPLKDLFEIKSSNGDIPFDRIDKARDEITECLKKLKVGNSNE